MQKDSPKESYKIRDLNQPRSKWKQYAELMANTNSLFGLAKYEFIVNVVGIIPGALGLALRKFFYPKLLGNCGKNVAFGKSITLRHPNKIHIGDNVIVDDYATLDAKGNSNDGLRIGSNVFIGRNTVIYTKNGDIIIEDNVNIGINCDIYSKNKVTIQKNSMIAAYCYIMSGGQYDYSSTTPFYQQDSTSKGPTTLGDSVWLGAKAVVQDGVSVGDRSVIGAGAVVTKDIPANCVAAGVPAKLINQ